MFNLNDIEYIGFNNVPKCNILVSKYFDYYVLDYCEKGELKLQMDHGEIKTLSGPVAWLTFPGPHFTFGVQPGTGYWNHRFVSFKGPLTYFYEQSGLFPVKTPIIKITDPENFTRTFDKLISLLCNMETKKTYRALHTLEELLLMLGEQPEVFHKSTPEKEKISSFIEKISKNPHLEFDFEKQSLKAGISYPHFRRVFKTITGMPPAQFVLQKRLEKAASLLRSGHKNIAEISNDCGFYDIYHLAKMFKKYYSVPPAKYRKAHLLK